VALRSVDSTATPTRASTRSLVCSSPSARSKPLANLAGKRWSKLAINSAISSLGTLGGDRFGPLVQHRIVRRLALEIMTEASRSRARRRSTRKSVGTIDLDWVALTDEERVSNGSPSLVAKHALLLAVGFGFAACEARC